MNIPQNQNLHSQSFNSKFVEFVWQFPYNKQIIKKFILHVKSDLSIYMTAEWINGDGALTWSNTTVFDKQCDMDNLESQLLDLNNWSEKCLPLAYEHFNGGKDLVLLVRDVIEYLK